MEGWIGPDSHVPRHTITDERLLKFAEYTVDDYVHKRVDTSVLKEYNYSLAPNGELYDLNKPCFLAEMMERVYKQRKSVKGEMFVHEKRKEYIEHLLNYYEGNEPDLPTTKDVGDEYAESWQGKDTSALTTELNYQKIEEKKKDLIQHAIKILLNSLYGSLGNKHFKYGEVENAEAITLYGQVVNKRTQIYINDLMNAVAGTEGKDVVCGGDTDSLVNNTLLNTSEGEITIGDFYEQYGEHYLRDLPDNKVRAVTANITTPCVSKSGQLKENQIKYVMKHKVKKEMFKVECNGKEVVITSDHSLVVWRDGQTQSIKPKEVQPEDQLLMIV